ncbi:MAG TPA: ATP-binding protein [Acidimicrobiales bacterium]|nr:ATP-binding protein [Acidimicrobiales bacterium]
MDTELELAVPARFQQVGALRRAASAFLAGTTDERLRHTLLLVVSELCTNAIEAVQNAHDELTLRIRNSDRHLIIEVEDRGPGFSAAFGTWGADDDAERGRGLNIVRSLVDEFAVERAQNRTTVRCSLAR